jgi:hypothetical protein
VVRVVDFAARLHRARAAAQLAVERPRHRRRRDAVGFAVTGWQPLPAPNLSAKTSFEGSAKLEMEIPQAGNQTSSMTMQGKYVGSCKK